MAVIRYHVNWPDGSDPYYLFNSGENNARTSYYAVSGVPYGRIDGNISAPDYSTWVSQMNTEMHNSSPVRMSLSGDFNPDSDTGHVIVTTYTEADSGYTSLKLRVVLTESRIHWTHYPSVSIHNQTFRDMIPNTTGKAITLTVGETRYDTFTFVTRSPINSDSSDIVAFIQSDRTSPSPVKRILQSAKIRVATLAYQLDAFSLISPPDRDTIPTCNPTLVWHPTIDPDSGFMINYSAEMALDPTFQEVLIYSDTIPDTSWFCPDCLMSDTTWYWRVLASNDHAPDRFSRETFRFVVHELGGCVYIPGDVNGNQQVNGVDVVYAVNYLKGTGAMPPVDCFPFCPLTTNPFYAAGDVNGNCSFNGIDITYYVRFLKGQATELLSCPDCPPAPGAMNKHRAKNFSILH